MDRTLHKDRFLKDDLPTRLGGIAANLARIRSFSKNPAHKQAVLDLIDQSKHYAEWATPSAPLNIQTELVELQIQLARWQLKIPSLWMDGDRRSEIASGAGHWAAKILELSGIMLREDNSPA
jgi:hypothetical protein